MSNEPISEASYTASNRSWFDIFVGCERVTMHSVHDELLVDALESRWGDSEELTENSG